MQAKEIKPGAVVNHDDQPVMIESVSVNTPSARGAATIYKYRARNLITRQKVDIALKGSESLPEADFERRDVKLMYTDPTHMHLLDQESYEQYTLELESVAQEKPFITEELEGIQAMIYNDQCIGLRLPTTVALLVTECDPFVKGNSATSRNKPATLETGLTIQVPEYLAQGERIKVDTRTGDFIGRA